MLHARRVNGASWQIAAFDVSIAWCNLKKVRVEIRGSFSLLSFGCTAAACSVNPTLRGMRSARRRSTRSVPMQLMNCGR